MKAELPYHFCAFLGCEEMTPHGELYCAWHEAQVAEGDIFLPGAEVLPLVTPNETNRLLPSAGAQHPSS